MTLLKEYINFDQSHCIVENISGGDGQPKKMYMKGIFIQGGIRNQNGRIYPVTEIRNAVENINNRIRSGESVVWFQK